MPIFFGTWFGLVLGPLRGQSGPPRFSCFSPEPYHCLRRVPGGLTGSFSVICLTGFWLDPRGGVARNGRKWLPGIEGAGNFLGFFNQNPLTFGHFDPMAKSDPPPRGQKWVTGFQKWLTGFLKWKDLPPGVGKQWYDPDPFPQSLKGSVGNHLNAAHSLPH